MKHLIHRARAGLAACCLGLFAASGAICHGHQAVGIQNLWDLTYSYEWDLDEIDFTFDIVQDTKGKVTGSAEIHTEFEGVQIDAFIELKGKVKSTTDGTTLVDLKLKYSGVATYFSETMKFKASQTVRAEIDPATQTMTGTIVSSFKVGGYSESYSDYFEMELDPDMDGSATLALETQQDEKGRILGTAGLLLSNGRDLPFTLKGKLNTGKGVVQLKVKGDKAAGNKGKLKLELTIDGQTVLVFSGKVLGQKLTLQSVAP